MELPSSSEAIFATLSSSNSVVVSTRSHSKSNSSSNELMLAEAAEGVEVTSKINSCGA